MFSYEIGKAFKSSIFLKKTIRQLFLTTEIFNSALLFINLSKKCWLVLFYDEKQN